MKKLINGILYDPTSKNIEKEKKIDNGILFEKFKSSVSMSKLGGKKIIMTCFLVGPGGSNAYRNIDIVDEKQLRGVFKNMSWTQKQNFLKINKYFHTNDEEQGYKTSSGSNFINLIMSKSNSIGKLLNFEAANIVISIISWIVLLFMAKFLISKFIHLISFIFHVDIMLIIHVLNKNVIGKTIFQLIEYSYILLTIYVSLWTIPSSTVLFRKSKLNKRKNESDRNKEYELYLYILKTLVFSENVNFKKSLYFIKNVEMIKLLDKLIIEFEEQYKSTKN